jgi:hypothetical protein
MIYDSRLEDLETSNVTLNSFQGQEDIKISLKIGLKNTETLSSFLRLVLSSMTSVSFPLFLSFRKQKVWLPGIFTGRFYL